jgi:oligopeptide transport system substrate-binding protein
MSQEDKSATSNTAGEGGAAVPDISRRQFMFAGGAGALGLYLAGRGGSLFKSEDPLREAMMARAAVARESLGMAPTTQQFMVNYSNSLGATYKALDFYETVYSRAPLADQFNLPLVRITKDFKIVPGTATNWKQTNSTTWEFYIKPGIMWSDGNELTANDYVETIRYSADPKHAWDFTFYWSGVIKNYTEAVAGKASLNSIGVSVGSNKYTFVVKTEGPIAYIPIAMLYSMPLSAAGLAKYGNGLYNINPATSITCGPYALKTFNPTAEVVVGPNAKYTGPYKPQIQYQISKIYNGTPELPLFETGQVDWTTQPLAPTDLIVAKKTSGLSSLKVDVNPQDFRIYYVFFQCTKPPFNNVKVRQAFAHSCDRNSIIKALLAPLAIPAYGYLMPGYPFAVSEQLEQYTNYDPELAQRLLAEAGYPKGKNFPTITFSYPTGPSGINPVLAESVVQALAAGWNSTLFGGNTTLLLDQLLTSDFYTKMEAKPDTQLQMGFITYGMDYFDASNMLSIYKSEQQGGRHDWNSAQFDNLLDQGAAAFNPSKRQEIYTEAQILQTKEAPAVFIWHGLYGYLNWPYLQGSALSPNYLGYSGLEWPQFQPFSTNQEELYVGTTNKHYPRANESGLI